MSIDFALVLLFAATVSLAAMFKGGRPERLIAGIIAADILLDRAYPLILEPQGFDQFSASRLFADSLQLVAFLWIALKADRVWPMWVAAAQLVCVSSSMAVMFVDGGRIMAYWGLTQLPVLVQLLALGIGILSHQRRLGRTGMNRVRSASTI